MISHSWRSWKNAKGVALLSIFALALGIGSATAPYFARSSGSSPAAIEELKAGGTVVGMFPDSKYQEQRIDLRAGDLMVAFTDGVTDAMNPNQEAFGEGRLKALVGQIADLPVAQIISRISQELRAWMRDAPQFDDLTFIVAKVKE